jgi:DNA repair protein RadC
MYTQDRYTLEGPNGLGDLEILRLALGDAEGGGAADQLLASFGDLATLSQAPVAALRTRGGLGPIRALRLHAALQAGLRAANRCPPVLGRAVEAEDIYLHLRGRLGPLEVEELHAVYVDRRQQILACMLISRGGSAATIVEPRQVFRPAIQAGAAALILVHNHPSGDPQPSHEDVIVTERIARLGQLLGIPLLDHLIITGSRYVSMLASGRMDAARFALSPATGALGER